MERSQSLADIQNSINQLQRSLSISWESLDNRTHEEIMEKIELARKILTTPVRKKSTVTERLVRRHSVALPLKQETWSEIMLSPVHEYHTELLLDEKQVVSPEMESTSIKEESYSVSAICSKSLVFSSAEFVVGVSGKLYRDFNGDLVLPTSKSYLDIKSLLSSDDDLLTI